jgi:catechol 2,3-dioxygenase-like lactoylglutathione lyase family enzyme
MKHAELAVSRACMQQYFSTPICPMGSIRQLQLGCARLMNAQAIADLRRRRRTMPKSINEKHEADSFSPAQLDAKGFPAPVDGFIITHLLIVTDQDRSRDFYSHVLGGQVIRERDPAVVRLSNSWIVINVGGGPTDDKPEVIVAPPQTSHVLTTCLNIRVADVWSTYREWRTRGAEFLTEPKDHGQEIRCYLRDPDGHLIEVGQSTGILKQQRSAA